MLNIPTKERDDRQWGTRTSRLSFSNLSLNTTRTTTRTWLYPTADRRPRVPHERVRDNMCHLRWCRLLSDLVPRQLRTHSGLLSVFSMWHTHTRARSKVASSVKSATVEPVAWKETRARIAKWIRIITFTLNPANIGKQVMTASPIIFWYRWWRPLSFNRIIHLWWISLYPSTVLKWGFQVHLLYLSI